MGLFKSIKDLSQVSKQAKELQRQQQEQAGYEPGLKGQFAQMGDMLDQANQQLAEITEQQSGQSELLNNGIAGESVVISHSPLEGGAQWQNAEIDMEVHVPGRNPYQVNNQYMVPAGARIGAGARLPVRVDPNDAAKIAIDWRSAQLAPARGEVRSSGGATPTAAAAPAATPSAGAADSGEDSIAQLERLAKLRDSGALTDAEFELQKARILGG